MKKIGSSSALNAAALQAHIWSGLGNDLKFNRPNRSTPTRNTRQMANHGRQIIQDRPTNYYASQNRVKKSNFDQQLARKNAAYNKNLSLAQKLNLVAKPPKPLNQNQWSDVEATAVQRQEYKGHCPIWFEPYGRLPCVILSCSHVFHAQCLKSFEQYSCTKSCPICRIQTYDSKEFKTTEEYYIDVWAIKIQSNVRGWMARKRFARLQRLHPPKDPNVRRKYFNNQLTSLTDKFVDHIETKNSAIDAFLESIQRNLEHSNAVFDSIYRPQQVAQEAPKPNPAWMRSEWTDIKAQARERGDTE